MKHRSRGVGDLSGERCSRSLLAAILLIAAHASLIIGASGGDWPQTGGNPQHTNFTPDSPAPPFEAIWQADFSPEFIYSAQPVVAGDRLFATTLNGNVYALSVETGERQWHFKAGEVMWGGAAVETRESGGEAPAASRRSASAGKVFVASWEGIVYGLEAATGNEVWRYDVGEPISGSPCLAERTLFIGTRRGTMLALGTDGSLKWRKPLSWHVYSTAAWNRGRVFVVTEDMFVHALDAGTGDRIWTSKKLNGICLREFYPVIHKGKVLVACTPSVYHPGGSGMGIKPFIWNGVSKELEEACLARNKEGKMPPELETPQQEIIRYYEQNPDYQTLYVFNEADGKDAFIPVRPSSLRREIHIGPPKS